MTDFYKMTPSEISSELDRYNRQLLQQQADKIPLTPAQLRRWHALSKAYKKIQCENAK